MLCSCAPVLHEEYMKAGLIDVPLSDMRENPEFYKRKLFILGGIIVNTKITEKGSLIEALYIPVNSKGYLRESGRSRGRFLAIYPKDSGLLDPVIYRKGKEITVAGEFIETRKGRIDEMEYTYPVFEIKEIYLWAERREYYYYPYYPPYYYPYWWYDQWWRPYPYWFWP